MLKYALLKTFKDDTEQIVEVRDDRGNFVALELNEDEFLRRLKARVHEEALFKLTRWKSRLTIDEWHDCMDKAVKSLLNDDVKRHSVREKKYDLK